MHRMIIIIMALALLLLPAAVSLAEEAQGGSDEMAQEDAGSAWEEMAELPPVHYVLTPEMHTYLGARVVDIQGSRRAGEYDYLKTRPVGGFKVHYTPLPHRLDLELDFTNEKDLTAEFDYAYRDLFLVEYTYRGLWHNLGHLSFREQAIDGANSSIDKDPGTDYGVEINDHNLFLRLKWPNEPFHLYCKLESFTKTGDIQQRFLLGRFGNLDKVSQKRNIDWDTQKINLGVNGHLGLVEIDYHHGIKDFSAKGEDKLVDFYPASGGRSAGNLYHNVVPDLERSWDTVMVHTTSTGRIVGTLTLTTGDKENKGNASHVDFDRISTGWTFIPVEGLTVALKYRHDKLEVENPETVVERDVLTGAPITRATPLDITDAVSRDTDVAQVAVKYAITKDINAKAEYKFESVDRKKAELWIDPEHGNIARDTRVHTTKLTVWARPVSDFDFRVNGIYSYSDDPAYSISYRNKLAANLKANWYIVPGLSMNAYYKMAREDNPFDFPEQHDDRDRHVFKDNAGAVLSWMPLDWLSTAAYYDFNRLKIKSTTTFEDQTGTAFVEQGTPYRDTSHVYGLSADTAFSGPVNFSGDVHQSYSRGRFFYTAVTPVGNDTTDIPRLNDLKLRETGGTVTAIVSLPKGWGVNASYTINDFSDLNPQPQTGSLDSTVHSGTLMVSKKW